MELRNCNSTHYFQAISGGLVIKVHSIDARGKPALSLKTLKDVYEREDAERLGRPKSDMDIMSAGSDFYNDQLTSETPCFPLVDRTLKEAKPAFDGFFLCGDNDDIDSDLDDNTTLKQLREGSKTKALKKIKLEFDEFVPCGYYDMDSDLDHKTTLKQLMERSKTKKRKFGSSTGVNSMHANVDRNPGEDESDIDEPLIIWKSKLEKNSKAKGKCPNKNVVTSLQASLSIKSEQNQLSEGSMQGDAKLPTVICVKAEVPEPAPQGCQTPTSFSNDSSTNLNRESKLGGIASNSHRTPMKCENREALFFAEECQNCVTNEVSYDHLEHVMPISMLLPSNGKAVKVEYQEMDCHEFLLLPPEIETEKDNLQVLSSRSSPAKIQGSYVCCTKSSSIMEEISGQAREDSSGQVLNLSADNNIGCTEPCNGDKFYLLLDNTKEDLIYEKNCSLTSPEKSCISSGYSSISLEITGNSMPLKDIMADEKSLTFAFDAVPRNGLNTENHLEDELSKSKKTQTPASPSTYKERKPSLDYQGCDIANTLPTLEIYQAPQRLLSTRKAISPSSEEQLCLNMNSVELLDSVDQGECKGELWLEKPKENVSSGRSDIAHAKMTENIGEPVVHIPRKVFISPAEILKKSQNCRAPLPKGNLEGPRFSRTLPNFSTDCSTKGCYESAIAFSQRQMRDIESLATKLTNELKFMKDIVAEKILFEACRDTSSRNNAEEVKAAIDNSTKAEETAKKWLSMMNRDCNRFCKIMKLSQNSVNASKNVVKRERKKIVFADEAGGKLCHVKFFEDGVASPVSVSQKQ